MRKVLIVLGLLLFTSVCTTVPITGRSQLNMMSDQTMVTAANANFAQFMGAVSKQDAEVRPTESDKAKSLLDSVQRVSDRVIDASGMRAQHNWQTVVVTLAVAELKYQPVVGAALGIGAQYGILLPFSRAPESEADRIGVILMAKAGYDPAEPVGVWERIEQMAGGGKWEFLSTHPSHETRRANLRSWLPEANPYYADRARPLPANLAELKTATIAYEERMTLAPIAPRPTLAAGFWETNKASNQSTQVTSRLQAIEPCSVGQCLVYETNTGRKTVQTRDYAVVEIGYPNGTSVQFSPPLPMAQWPLRIGNSWTQDTTIDHSAQWRRTVQLKGTVVSYENVNVPAGSFMAFKIVVSLGGRRFAEAWYAPEAKTVVRSIGIDARGAEVVTELQDYQRTADAVDASEENAGRKP